MNTVEIKQNAVATFDGVVMKEIKKVVKNISKKVAVPIFNYAKVDIVDGSIKLTIINNDFIITKTLEANTTISGSFLIPLEVFRKERRIANNNQYSFEILEGNKVAYFKNNSKQILQTIELNEFPKIPNNSTSFINIISYDDIIKIDKALLSVTKMEARPILQHVLIRDGKVATTDSHRLYRNTVNIHYDDDIILYSSGVKKLKDVFSRNSDIHVSIGKSYAIFSDDDTTVMINLHDGNYPKIERLINIGNANLIVTIHDVKEFKQIIQDAANVSKNTKNNVVKFEISKNKMIIASNNDDLGSYQSELEVITSHNDELRISLNGRYMLDAIKQIDASTLVIHFNGSMRPFNITDGQNEDQLALILPVRVY